MDQDISCDGGNQTLAGLIKSSPSAPNIYELYSEWTKSADEKPIVTGFKIQSISSLVFNAKSKKLSDMFIHTDAAFNYLAVNPQVHKTHVTLDITTDWCEFTMLSPNAYVEADPQSPTIPYITRAKVGWNSAMRGVMLDVIIR